MVGAAHVSIVCVAELVGDSKNCVSCEALECGICSIVGGSPINRIAATTAQSIAADLPLPVCDSIAAFSELVTAVTICCMISRWLWYGANGNCKVMLFFSFTGYDLWCSASSS